MAQDHFVAQTYLRAFVDPETMDGSGKGGKIHAYSKKDLKYFTPAPAAVCKTVDWDRNPKYLSVPDALGQWLDIFEPHWASAVERLADHHHLSQTDKFLLAGYWAYLSTCTPTWQRVATGLQQSDLEERYIHRFIEHAKAHPAEYPQAQTYMPLINDGSLKVAVDKNYPKAVLTMQLRGHQWFLYHQEWKVIWNDTGEPFLTSDNPSCFDYGTALHAARYLPLTPRLALWTSGDLANVPDMVPDLAPVRQSTGCRASAKFVREMNILMIKSAEMLVLSSVHKAFIATCVEKYRTWWVCRDVASKIAARDGYYEVVQTRALPRKPAG
jgi:hypothetical protein